MGDCHTHKILTHVKLAGLEAARAAGVVANPNLGTNWNIVKDWSELSRYERHSLMKAQRLHDATNHTTDGVLPWVKKHW